MRPAHLLQLVWRAIRSAARNDVRTAGACVDEITDHGSRADAYSACCSFAELGIGALRDLYQVRAAPHLDPEEMWVLSGAPLHDPNLLFAARFLTVYANGDYEMAKALVRAVEEAGPEARSGAVCALLAIVTRFRREADERARTKGGLSG